MRGALVRARYNHLWVILSQNKGNLTIGDHHYWAGDEGYVFRRKEPANREKGAALAR